jgi:hypothetical protein
MLDQMESFMRKLCWLAGANVLPGGMIGIAVGILLLIGLVYLFINRNQVLTITYGLVLAGMVLFNCLSILVLLFISIYGLLR